MHPTKWMVLAPTLLLLTVLCACSGGDDDDPMQTGDGDGDGDDAAVALPDGFGDAPDRNRVEAGAVCGRLAVIQCIAERDCCDDPGRDLATCLQEQTDVCDTELLADRVSLQAAAGFDEDRAERALGELESLARDCDPDITAYSLSQEGFGSIFAGTVSPGQNCRPTNLNDRAMAGAALVACSGDGTHACLPSASMWRCEPRAESGGACFTDNNCLDDLYCDNTPLSLAGGTCVARNADGATCAGFTECLSLACVDGMCVAPSAQSAYCFAR